MAFTIFIVLEAGNGGTPQVTAGANVLTTTRALLAQAPNPSTIVVPEPAVSPVPLRAGEENEAAAGAQAGAAEAPPRSVSVTVVDIDDRPVADAVIEAFAPVNPLREIEALGPRSKVHAPTPDRILREKRASDQTLALFSGEEPDDATWAAPLGTWRTDAVGNARVTVPAAETCLVATHDPEGASGEVKLIPADEGETGAPVRLELRPRGRLDGLVLDKSGEPAAGAEVIFTRSSSHDEQAALARLPRPLVADAGGRFSIEVDGALSIRAHAEMPGRKTPDEYVYVGPGRQRDIELRFAGGFVVTGVVIGPDGRPVLGASVELGGYEVKAERVTTGEDGHFRLELSRPCHAVVLAKTKGWVTDEGVPVTLSEAEPSADIVIRVVKPATVSGRVEWSDGTPIGRVMVISTPMREGPTTHADSLPGGAPKTEDELAFTFDLGQMAIADADGRFRLETIHPRFPLTISCFGGEALPGSVTVQPVLPGAADVRLVFQRSDVGADRIAGRVIDGVTRAPVESFRLTHSSWLYGQPAGYGEKLVRVDDRDGRFELTGLDPHGEYGLVIECSGYPRKVFGPLTPAADSDVELTLDHHASLRVTVRGPDGGPLAGASIQLMDRLENSFGAIFAEVSSRAAGPDGLLLWPELAPGEYSIEAASGALRSPRQRVTLPAGRETTLELQVVEPAASGRLEVRTTHQDGSPWGGAQIKVVRYVSDNESTTDLDPVHVGTSGDDGRLVLEHLVPAAYIIEVSGEGTIIPLGRIEVLEQGTATISIAGKK